MSTDKMRLEALERLKDITGLSIDESRKLLEENDWNLENSLNVFKQKKPVPLEDLPSIALHPPTPKQNHEPHGYTPEISLKVLLTPKTNKERSSIRSPLLQQYLHSSNLLAPQPVKTQVSKAEVAKLLETNWSERTSGSISNDEKPDAHVVKNSTTTGNGRAPSPIRQSSEVFDSVLTMKRKMRKSHSVDIPSGLSGIGEQPRETFAFPPCVRPASPKWDPEDHRSNPEELYDRNPSPVLEQLADIKQSLQHITMLVEDMDKRVGFLETVQRTTTEQHPETQEGPENPSNNLREGSEYNTNQPDYDAPEDDDDTISTDSPTPTPETLHTPPLITSDSDIVSLPGLGDVKRFSNVSSTSDKQPTVALPCEKDTPKSEYGKPGYYKEAFVDEEQERASILKSQTQEKPNKADDYGRDCMWNTKFRLFMDQSRKVNSSTPLEEKIRINTELSNLAADFTYTAKTYAKIIISEIGLPEEEKTVKPNLTVGGIAGGEKFLVNSILFKFAVDMHGIFNGDDEKAAKLAGNDLLGLISYNNANIDGLDLPMTAIVDYMGYRVIAVSKLPIDKSSIVYGSADAGKTVHNSDQIFSDIMKQAAEKLNLKPHKDRSGQTILYSSTDLEGHIGKDGKRYLVDFSRALPPEFPLRGNRGSVFYRMLRPELVRSNPVPLNPDACSSFINEEDRQESSEQIRLATERLHIKLIPQFARELDSIQGEDQTGYLLVSSLHKRGINLRWIGEVRSYLTDEYWRTMLFIEMCARTAKMEVRAMLRSKQNELKDPGVQPYKIAIIGYLNRILGESEDSTLFWNEPFRESIKSKYHMAFTHAEQDPSYSLQSSLEYLANYKCLIFYKLHKMLGLRFQQVNRFIDSACTYKTKEPFDVIDLEEIVEAVKQMNVVALAQGYVLKTKLRTKRDDEFAEICSQAIWKFEEALQSMPDNKVVLMHLADLYKSKGDIKAANKYYINALEVDNTDPITLYKYASFLSYCNRIELADTYFQRSLQNDAPSLNCLQDYAEFVAKYHSDLNKAEELYLKSIELAPERPLVYHNYALFLIKYKEDYDHAKYYLKKALRLDSKNPILLASYAWFTKNILGKPEKAEKILKKKDNTPSSIPSIRGSRKNLIMMR